MAREDAPDIREVAVGAGSETDSAHAGFELTFIPARLVLGLAIAIVFLLATHTLLTIYHYEVEELPWLPWRQLFDVDEENNLPTWFSGFMLSLVAACLWLAARRARAEASPSTIHWYALASGFLLLSLDEVAGLHETVNSLTDTIWAIPGGIVAGLAGLAFIPFLRQLPVRTALLFALAGFIYVGGAVGVEILGEPMDSDTLLYNLTTVVEEGMEMAGALLFLWALLGHMRRDDDSAIQVSVRVR